MLMDDFFQVCVLVCQRIAQGLKILFAETLYICHDSYYFTDTNFIRMKKLSLFFLLFAAACSSKKMSPSSDPNAVIVSMDGIGDLKIGMNIQSVEKLLKHKLVFSHPSPGKNVENRDTSDLVARDSSDIRYPDTLSVKYKNTDYEIWFEREWSEDIDAGNRPVTISQIISHSPQLKTPSGIGIGDDLQKIVNAYADSDYEINIRPVFDFKTNDHTRIKGKSEVTIGNGIVGSNITFFLINNKVESMRVSFNTEAE